MLRSRSIDLTRYGPIIVVSAGVLSALLAWNVALAVVAGPLNRWFPIEEDQTDWFHLERAGGRIAGVESQLRGSGAKEREPVGVLIGLSTLEYAIDPVALEREVGPPVRWLGVNGYTGGVHKVADFADAVLASRLEPVVLVVAINEFMLVGKSRLGDEPELTTVDWRRAWRWSIDRRYYVKHLVRRNLIRARTALLHRFGLGASAIFEPVPDPWQADTAYRETASKHFDEAQLRNEAAFYGRAGFFDPDSFERETAGSRDLVRIVEAAKRRRIRPVVVLLPETSALRARLPATSRDRVAEILRRSFGAEAPEIIDLRDSVPDSGFINLGHTDLDGQKIATEALARRLKTIVGAEK